MAKDVQIKRAYDPPAKTDAYRVLVDRVWPRGLRKEELHLNEWAKDLAPSTKLRQWFGHDPKRWDVFQQRYKSELAGPNSKAEIQRIVDAAKDYPMLTLVYSAKDKAHNQAVVLCGAFARRLSGARRPVKAREAPVSTWQPFMLHGRADALAERELPATSYAFPRSRELPLIDPQSIRRAWKKLPKMAERDEYELGQARVNIRHAAEFHGIALDD